MKDSEFFNEQEKSLDEDKQRWLFLENIRLEQEKKDLEEEKRKIEEDKKNLDDERSLIEIQKGMLSRQQRKNMLLSKQLHDEKELFDKKWKLLEDETRRLAIDKERFERDKAVFRDQAYREARKSQRLAENVSIFFKGVNDTESLKKRYHALIKMFHPDNGNSDKDVLTAIMKEYEKLKRFYIGS